MLRLRPWVLAPLASTAVAVSVASYMTFADWRLNPSGIFHGDRGTSWTVMWETWISWFTPVLGVSAGILVPLWIGLSRLRRLGPGTGPR